MAQEFFPQRPAAHPMIYAYEDTNPQYRGLLKVGYTTVDVDRRVAQRALPHCTAGERHVPGRRQL